MPTAEMSAEQVEAALERILPRVSKPGRYTGGELNSVRRDWERARVRLALAFPDLYDLGMSNLGMMVLYDIVNRRPDMVAERVFSPWTDMELAMRTAGVPLFTLETKRPVCQFDVLGISLPYEQLYSNAINLLDLSGLPLLSVDRRETHPLVLAGGHATYNPEPMAPFIDAFAIGEGEELLVELLEIVGRWKADREGRESLLRRLARVSGLYVPSFYHVRYHASGIVQSVQPVDDSVPPVVRKRITPLLPPPPTRPIVPNIATVHDRAVVEIMRGCSRGCRFCHAGFATRPVRERPLPEVLEAVDSILASTGYEEVALLSLSSSDYSRIVELVQALACRYPGSRLNISLPSLRIETSSADLMEALRGGRKGSATFAPEAATERMRGIINKMIPDSEILEVTDAVFSRGWRTLKLYFMIGQPEETLDDVKAIADLAWAVVRQGRKYHGGRARVHLGVSTFVPKPHTPFQWATMDTIDQMRVKQSLLMERTAGRGLELKWNKPEETVLEGVLSRGDRRLGPVIHRAWQLGARFDAWQEHFDLGAWQQAMDEANLSMAFYNQRRRPEDEHFPWDHIDTGVTKAFLATDYRRSQRGEPQSDCRQGCLACGILDAFGAARRGIPSDAWGCP